MQAKQIAKQHGMLSVEEVDLIYECCDMLPDKAVIVNIGAGAGTSTLAFLEKHTTCFVFEIDIEERPLAVQNTSKYHDRLARIRGKSQIVGKNWPFLVDCVFVDGSHTNEAVQGDIDSWLPKVKLGGIILFHDYDHRNVPGLTVIVDKAMTGYEVVGKERYLIAYSTNVLL